MRVLGIDPGTFKMGVGVVQSEAGSLSMVHAGVIVAKKSLPLPERLHVIHESLVKLMHDIQPSVVAIEEPFVAKNVRAAMAVGQAQAIAMLVAASNGIEVATYAPRSVKQAVTDYGGSSKDQVQEMVCVLLDLESAPIPFDATDALAVAICHVNASQILEVAEIN